MNTTKDTSGKTPAQLEAEMVGGTDNVPPGTFDDSKEAAEAAAAAAKAPLHFTEATATDPAPHVSKPAATLAAKAADVAKKPATTTTAQTDGLAWAKWFERGLYIVLIFVVGLLGGLIAKSDESAIADRVFARVQAMSSTPAATQAPVAKKNNPVEVKAPAETNNLVVDADTGTAME